MSDRALPFNYRNDDFLFVSKTIGNSAHDAQNKHRAGEGGGGEGPSQLRTNTRVTEMELVLQISGFSLCPKRWRRHQCHHLGIGGGSAAAAGGIRRRQKSCLDKSTRVTLNRR